MEEFNRTQSGELTPRGRGRFRQQACFLPEESPTFLTGVIFERARLIKDTLLHAYEQALEGKSRIYVTQRSGTPEESLLRSDQVDELMIEPRNIYRNTVSENILVMHIGQECTVELPADLVMLKRIFIQLELVVMHHVLEDFLDSPESCNYFDREKLRTLCIVLERERRNGSLKANESSYINELQGGTLHIGQRLSTHHHAIYGGSSFDPLDHSASMENLKLCARGLINDAESGEDWKEAAARDRAEVYEHVRAPVEADHLSRCILGNLHIICLSYDGVEVIDTKNGSVGVDKIPDCLEMLATPLPDQSHV